MTQVQVHKSRFPDVDFGCLLFPSSSSINRFGDTFSTDDVDVDADVQSVQALRCKWQLSSSGSSNIHKRTCAHVCSAQLHWPEADTG